MPRFRVLAQVLVRLAEAETQMIAINRIKDRRTFFRAHARDLALREAIGLEIGEAPIGVAEARSDSCCLSVGFDGLLLPSDTLQRVSVCDMQHGGPWRSSEQLFIRPDRRAVLSKAGARCSE